MLYFLEIDLNFVSLGDDLRWVIDDFSVFHCVYDKKERLRKEIMIAIERARDSIHTRIRERERERVSERERERPWWFASDPGKPTKNRKYKSSLYKR